MTAVKITQEPLRAYNMTVADYHTYFIKGVEGDDGVWVHNNCDKRLPVPEKVTASNGLGYKSNPKHTLGGDGNRGNAGIEPSNSLNLFERSTPSPKTFSNKEVRYAKDSDGNIHRFEGTNGVFHWNGSTGNISSPLDPKLIPIEIRRSL